MMDKTRWLAATPYLMVQLMVLVTLISGYYHLDLIGIRVNFYLLIPFLIFYFVNKDNAALIVASHVRKAMRLYLLYLALSVILYFIVSFGVFAAFTRSQEMMLISTFLGVGLAVPWILLLIYVFVSSTRGAIKAFKLVLPNGEKWFPWPDEVPSGSLKMAGKGED